MKFRVRIAEGDWYIPEVKKLFWGWVQISGGRTSHEKASAEIGRYVLGETN